MVREGVKEYQDEKFNEAEVNFRKALDAKPELFEAEYNIANSLYKQKKFKESAGELDKLLQKSNNAEQRADIYHNLGNSHLMSQEYEKAIDAYKNSLRIRPEDEDSRYNLAYAMQMMKQQQQQNQEEQNKEQQENKDNKDDQQKQDQKNKEDQKKGEKEIPDQQLSQQETEQMLNAIQNQEKEVKEKVDKKKAVARPVATEKDW